MPKSFGKKTERKVQTPVNRGLFGQFLRYVIPSITAMVVFTLYTMVDGFFVARYNGEFSLSAVNISLPFINMLFGIAIIFSVGTQTIVGVLLGRGERERANRVFSFVTCCLVIFSALLTLFSFVFSEQIAIFLGATEILMEEVLIYLRIIVLFSSCFIVSYNMEVLVKVDGFPVLATLAVVVSAVTNIVLDYIFVGLQGWGVAGAAVATGISQAVSIFIYMYHFVFGKSKLKFTKFRWKFKLFQKILPIGLGDFITEIGVGTILFLYNHFLIQYSGELAVASFTVIGYVNQVVAMCFAGITQGIQPLVSYYFGSGEREKYVRLLKYAFYSIVAVGVVSLALVLVFADGIYLFFFGAEKADFIADSALAMRKFSVAFAFMGFNLLVAGFASALMKPRYAIIISLNRTFIILLLALVLLGNYFGEAGLWYASAFAEGICLVFSAFFIVRVLSATKRESLAA
ncbi:MAG: MATE family efflux transporter [Bacillota bacterium]|nr:MATE family efflux transporter [Bacillota bacterium]